MNKKDEEELLEWKEQYEKEKLIEQATRGRIMLRCSTVIIAIWTAIGGIGAWASAHFHGLEAAIRAYIQTEYK